jgi:hypothetical protein
MPRNGCATTGYRHAGLGARNFGDWFSLMLTLSPDRIDRTTTLP